MVSRNPALSCLNVSSQFVQVHAALFYNLPSDTHLPLAHSDDRSNNGSDASFTPEIVCLA
jgi:hypothetical protein